MNRPGTIARHKARRKALTARIAAFIEANPGCTGNQLQAHAGVNHQLLFQRINDLMTAGHVTRYRDPGDRRIWRYRADAADAAPPARPRPACEQCGKPLPPRKRRFCSGTCSTRRQKTERVTENSDYAASVVRQIRRMGTRASGDLEALAWLSGAVDHARDALALAVAGCRAEGYSDAEIGHALGITRQAVGQRFGRKQGVYAGRPEMEVPA